MTTFDPIGHIAVVAASGRFPRASNVRQLWSNLVSGVDGFTDFSVDDIVAAGLPRELASAEHFVRRCPAVTDALAIDPDLFGCSVEQAARIDPQHRMFVSCVRDALVAAGIDPRTFDGVIGLWGGTAFPDYFLRDLSARFGPFAGMPELGARYPSDSLCGLAARTLGLRGPSITVQTACSTSLVAVHFACESLRTGQCDVALAGGVSLQYSLVPGYLYKEGEIFAPDGYCRTFDAAASGTVLGDGCAVVVLRRFGDAVERGDEILGVIRGSAVNNDGAARAGFTAPGMTGQVEVIRAAQHAADVSADDISYVEAHGTGTPVGDPLEVGALTEAFRASSQQRGYCALGATKASIGHLDAAAGVTGLIKTLCALGDARLPAVKNFRQPNPALELAESPFFVVDRTMPWTARNGRRIAGVSSFGLGGTNAHMIVEQSPQAARATE